MSDHVVIEELADAAAGVLDDERAGQVVAHVQSCAECRENWDALSEVSDLLAAMPAPVMPPAVALRLNEVLATEQRRAAAPTTGPLGASRGSVGVSSGGGQATSEEHPNRLGGGGLPRTQSLGVFGADFGKHHRSRFVVGALVACVTAALVGFGGYVFSASAGLNEPSATAPAVVSTARLGAQAHSLLQGTDLSPHRFSQAWRCARGVTHGRISAITNAVVDGQPALLVYTQSEAGEQVTVVTGCQDRKPVAGASTTLPG